jgi:hypothetical protein
MTPQAVPVIAPADAASFEAVRPRLFGIAYRTLESAADADDVVQNTWIRWQRTDRNKVRDEAAFLGYDHEAPRAQRRAIGSCTPRDVHRPVASRPDRPPSRSRARRGATRAARARGAHAHGEAVCHRTSRLRAPRSVRLPLPADLRRARGNRGERPATRHPCPPVPGRRTSQAGQLRRAAATSGRLRRCRTDRRSRNARPTARRSCRQELPGRHRGIALGRHAGSHTPRLSGPGARAHGGRAASHAWSRARRAPAHQSGRHLARSGDRRQRARAAGLHGVARHDAGCLPRRPDTLRM